MSETWVVEAADSGLRLDKFLAAESAPRISWTCEPTRSIAGRIFLNDEEAGPADAARRLEAGRRRPRSGWIDRAVPAS